MINIFIYCTLGFLISDLLILKSLPWNTDTTILLIFLILASVADIIIACLENTHK